jgi:tripartite-type tricarboxylate transporter receptor subunit TctC
VHLYPKLPYDPLKDFTPIGLAASNMNMLVVNPQFQAKTIPEFIKAAQASAGALNYGSSGSGGINHLATAEFAARFGGIGHGVWRFAFSRTGRYSRRELWSPLSRHNGLDGHGHLARPPVP